MKILKIFAFAIAIVFIISLIIWGSIQLDKAFPNFMKVGESFFSLFFLLCKMFGVLILPAAFLIWFVKKGGEWIE
jgi:hypothetical protein